MAPKNTSEQVAIKPSLKKRKCIIEDVVMKKSGRVEPLLVDFANGVPMESTELRGNLHQKVSHDQQHLSSSQRILTVETPKLSYAGTQTDSKSKEKVAVFLGVLNTETGKLRLVEASKFSLRPVLEQHTSTSPQLQNTPHSLTFSEKQEAVATAFGSKRAVQLVNRRKQYQVETETMSGAIDQAAAAAVGHTGAIEHHLEQQERMSLMAILPPCDREATRVEDVYKLEDLAPDVFLAHLEEPVRELLAGKDPDPGSTLLFKELVAHARLEAEEGRQVRLMSVALLVRFMVAFLRLSGWDMKNIDKLKGLEDCPPRVTSKILREYTQKQGSNRIKTQQDTDRAACLTLILALIANKYELPIATLLQSVPLNRDRLTVLMKIIGATYVYSSQSFVLKLPLVIYTRPFKRSSKQRGKR